MIAHILCVVKKAFLKFIFNLTNQRGDHHVIRWVNDQNIQNIVTLVGIFSCLIPPDPDKVIFNYSSVSLDGAQNVHYLVVYHLACHANFLDMRIVWLNLKYLQLSIWSRWETFNVYTYTLTGLIQRLIINSRVLYFDLYELRNQVNVKFNNLIWYRVVIIQGVDLIILYRYMLPYVYNGYFVGITLI